jgi:hypothetical protein
VARDQRGIVLTPYLIAFVVGAIAIGAVYLYGSSQGAKSVRLEWEEANRLQREKEAQRAAEASQKLETERVKTKVVYRTITERVNVEIEKPVYRDTCLPPDGLRLARCAIRGESPDTCKLDDALPAPRRPEGRLGGVGLKVDHRDGGGLPGLRLQASGLGGGG